MTHKPTKLTEALKADNCLTVWIEPPHKWKEAQPDWNFRSGADNSEALSRWCPEPSFGTHPCPCCDKPDSQLAGDRYTVSIRAEGLGGWDCRWSESEDICPDCYAFLAAEGRHLLASHIHLTVYELSRCFGGHEEGGWWFDWYNLPDPAAVRDAVGEPLTYRVTVAEYQTQAEMLEAAMKHLASKMGYCFAGDLIDTGHGPRKARSHCSVRPEVNAVVTWELAHGQHASKERPHYC